MNTLFFEQALTAAGTEEPATWFVVVLGIGTVFVGLIGIILICKLMSWLVSLGNGNRKAAPAEPVKAAAAPAEEIPNRQELVAAVSAAVAEELGTDISAIRVLSFKKL